MEVELHQLLLRYERLRKRAPRAERTLLASLAEIGQQTPVVVVADAERFVLIDGYKRVRALKRLAHDVVLAETRVPLAFLMYPQADTAGVILNCLDPDRFKYSINAYSV